jgi:hypothetical protein
MFDMLNGPGTKEKLEYTYRTAVAVYDMRFGPATPQRMNHRPI